MSNTDLHPSEDQKPRRKPGSFVLKITLAQFFRAFWLIVRIDLLVALLCAGLLFARLESTVAMLLEMPAGRAAAYADLTDGMEASTGTEPVGGVQLHHRLDELLDILPGAYHCVVLVEEPGYSSLPFWKWRPQYEVSVPLEDGRFFSVVFDLGDELRRFGWGMLALSLLELLMLIGVSNASRRSTRATLAPIQQLAATAQSISAEPEGLRGSPDAPDELELAGTIDALNRITAKHLDTRIAIDGEREELRDLAGAINSMLDRLNTAYSSQLRFVSDASHELRTPIAVIQGYANLLDRWGKEDPEALQESIDAIKAEAEGMKTLVEQLLFLARSDNNSIVMDVKKLDAAALATEVLRDTQVIDQNHAYVSDIHPPIWVEGDAGLLKQALRIFMDNAVKYTPEGERIRMSASQQDGKARIAVTDNGIGIPEKDLHHVFERFFRSDESRARATGGTGLGLSIAQWTVRRHGGHVEILSREDIGTRLTMVLPVSAPPSTEPVE